MTEVRCSEENIIDISDSMCIYPDKLRKYMESAGLSQATLAKKAGVPESTVRKLLQGETRDPRVSTLVPILKAANADANPILGLTSAREVPAELSKEGALLVDALRAQIDGMREQDKESDRRLVNLRTMLFDAGKGQAAAEGRAEALEAMLAQKAELLREQTETIAQYECRLEQKRHRIEELAAELSASKASFDGVKIEVAAVRQSRDRSKRLCKRLIWALCSVIAILAGVVTYSVWEIANINQGRTAIYLEEYIGQYYGDE